MGRVVDMLIRDNNQKSIQKKRMDDGGWDDTIERKSKPFQVSDRSVFQNVMDENALNTAPSVFDRTAIFRTEK